MRPSNKTFSRTAHCVSCLSQQLRWIRDNLVLAVHSVLRVINRRGIPLVSLVTIAILTWGCHSGGNSQVAGTPSVTTPNTPTTEHPLSAVNSQGAPSSASPQPEQRKADVLLSIKAARWYDDKYDKAPKGLRELLVIIKLTNRSRGPIHYSDAKDLSISVVRESDPNAEGFAAKGVAIKQEFLWTGMPKGVTLKSKSGGTSATALDPESNYGTHWFLPSNTYDLAIQPGGSFDLPVFYIVPAKYKSLTLMVKGAEATSITVGK